MGVAVAIVADVVWSAAVSYAASKVIAKVATKLGVSDKHANILGAIGGIAAGAAVFGDASGAINSAGATSVVNPMIAAPTNPAIDTPVSGVAGEYGGAVAETASGTSTVAPIKDAAADASWWQGDTTKTMMAGTASGMAQGYVVGEQMADEAAEVRKAEEREIQADKDRVKDWTNFNDSATRPKMTDSVKLDNPLNSVAAPTVNTPRAGMLTRPV